MKGLVWLVVVIALVTGCSVQDQSQLFETKDQAIRYFIEDQAIEGSIAELDIGEQEVVLLVEQSRDTYYVGEIAKVREKYKSVKISGGVYIGNTTGAMWDFETYKGNEYTLKLSKAKEDNEALYNEQFGLFISIALGKRTYEDRMVKNIINESETITVK
ncbi:hypothetical protein [Gorillibacterium massiliense]|uniref:hypothetical protein n=1 Tax=Gorillibacterium massiliense TaxID=1280390 RepID=UPI0004B5F383|nr:hypothetical protein [Gorillibacterium massiliense]